MSKEGCGPVTNLGASSSPTRPEVLLGGGPYDGSLLDIRLDKNEIETMTEAGRVVRYARSEDGRFFFTGWKWDPKAKRKEK